MFLMSRRVSAPVTLSGGGGARAQRFGIEVDDVRNQAAVGKEAAIHSERSAVQARAPRPRSPTRCASCVS